MLSSFEARGARRARDERGQAVMVAVMVLALCAALMLAAANLSVSAVSLGRGQAIADAVALGTTVGGSDVGAEVARRNGATLIAHSEVEGVMRVEVRVDGVSAVASARLSGR